MLNLQRLSLPFFLITTTAYSNSALELIIPEELTLPENSEIQGSYSELLSFHSTLSKFFLIEDISSYFDPTLMFILNSLQESLLHSNIPPCIKELNETFTALLALNASINTMNSFIKTEGKEFLKSEIQTTINFNLSLKDSVTRMRSSAKSNYKDLKANNGILWGSPLLQYYSKIEVLSELFKIFITHRVEPKILDYKNLINSRS